MHKAVTEIVERSATSFDGAAWPQDGIDAPSRARDVAFRATVDGSEQRYIEMLPPGFDPARPHDLVAALHGHGSDRRQFAFEERPECRAFREFAARHHMIAIAPDYRATTSWMGPLAEADLLQIIGELKAKYRPGRVFLAGGSMGASAALTFAVLHPDLVDGVAALNGLANHLEYENFQEAITASFGGTKAEIPLEYQKRSAEYWPERLTMPIAFTTGGMDTAVPPASVLRLAAVLRQLGRRVLLLHRPETGHSTSFADSLAALEFIYEATAAPSLVARPAPD